MLKMDQLTKGSSGFLEYMKPSNTLYIHSIGINQPTMMA
jgi:hypothetical protein